MRADLADKAHVVYRVYGRRGHLLYLGVSHDVLKRFKGHHADRAVWMHHMTSVTVEFFPDGPSAYAAEAKAVKAELPVYNRNSEPTYWWHEVPMAEHNPVYVARHAA